MITLNPWIGQKLQAKLKDLQRDTDRQRAEQYAHSHLIQRSKTKVLQYMYLELFSLRNKRTKRRITNKHAERCTA